MTRFLLGKDKVKITIMFRGREVTHPERGTALLDRLAEELSEIAVVEQSPIQDGRNMTMLLAPSKAVLAGETDHQAEDGKPEVRGKQSRRERARAEANAGRATGTPLRPTTPRPTTPRPTTRKPTAAAPSRSPPRSPKTPNDRSADSARRRAGRASRSRLLY